VTDETVPMPREALLDEYEQLRANALGATNRPRGLAVLLRHGLGAWIRLAGSLGPSSTGRERRGIRAPVADGDVGTATVVVLADAILTMTRAATGVGT
jgi:hypothetical protein